MRRERSEGKRPREKADDASTAAASNAEISFAERKQTAERSSKPLDTAFPAVTAKAKAETAKKRIDLKTGSLRPRRARARPRAPRTAARQQGPFL
jgi:hypothetical protein